MVATVNASTSAGVVITPDNSGVLAFQSSSATALTIDASQNSTFVGTASATKLIPTGSSATGNGLYLPAANSLGLSTNGTNAVYIDSSQNVGIGATPNSKLYIRAATNANLRVTDASGTLNLSAENDAGSAQVAMKFNGSQMMLTSAGELLVNGTATPVNGLKMAITNGSVKWSFGPDGSGNYCVFNASSAGVYVTNGGTSWTGTSDERLKTDLIPITNGLQKVNSLRSVTGRFKTDEEGTSRSFLIAQDVQAVFPEAVNTLNDEIGTLGLAYTDVIPLLVASIKELKAINDTLTARIVALENR